MKNKDDSLNEIKINTDILKIKNQHENDDGVIVGEFYINDELIDDSAEYDDIDDDYMVVDFNYNRDREQKNKIIQPILKYYSKLGHMYIIPSNVVQTENSKTINEIKINTTVFKATQSMTNDIDLEFYKFYINDKLIDPLAIYDNQFNAPVFIIEYHYGNEEILSILQKYKLQEESSYAIPEDMVEVEKSETGK